MPSHTTDAHILALETSGPLGGVAVARGGELIEAVRLAEDLRHARDLVRVARDAVRRAGWGPREIDLVAVSIGPGSFTGLRIAVTFAKIVAWDTGARVVAVPTLRAMAENTPADRRRIAAVLDAKRGGLYASVFERRGEALEETFGPALVTPADLADRLKPPTLVLGRGLRKAREALAAFEAAPEGLWDPRPETIARLGHALDTRGVRADPLRLEPIYIRRPEAEEVWERRHGPGRQGASDGGAGTSGKSSPDE